MIKELAPLKGAATDEILGVGEFQSKYFLDYPVYLDSDKAFYTALGKFECILFSFVINIMIDVKFFTTANYHILNNCVILIVIILYTALGINK